MNKVAFVMSSILTMLGIVILSWMNAVNALLPKIGYLANKGSSGRIYTDTIFGRFYTSMNDNYVFDALGLKIIAVSCIIIGLLMCVFFYIKGLKSEKTA